MSEPNGRDDRVSEQKADSLTRIERSLHQIKQSALFLVLGFLLSGVVFSGELARSLKDLRDLVTGSSDALTVSQADTQDRIIRDFVETAWRRLYWSRNFLARLDREAPSVEVHESWMNLLKSTEEMAAKSMV